MTDLVQDTEWQDKALELRTTGLGTSEIGEAVGKHPATIRRLFARNPVSEASDRVLSSAEASEAFAAPQGDLTGPSPNTFTGDTVTANVQTTVDDFTTPDRDPLEEFRAEAGEAVGPMPPEKPQREMDGGEEVDPPVFVKGTRQLALDFGENAAMVTAATLVLKSEKLAAGHFGLGDVITGTFTARIVQATGAEKFDKDIGDFTAKPTAQVALVTEFEVDHA